MFDKNVWLKKKKRNKQGTLTSCRWRRVSRTADPSRTRPSARTPARRLAPRKDLRQDIPALGVRVVTAPLHNQGHSTWGGTQIGGVSFFLPANCPLAQNLGKLCTGSYKKFMTSSTILRDPEKNPRSRLLVYNLEYCTELATCFRISGGTYLKKSTLKIFLPNSRSDKWQCIVNLSLLKRFISIEEQGNFEN